MECKRNYCFLFVSSGCRPRFAVLDVDGSEVVRMGEVSYFNANSDTERELWVVE